MRTKFLIFLCLFAVVFLNCKKKKKKWKEVSMEKDFIEYVDAKNASWFVFKDTVSGNMDTLTVSEYKFEVKEFSEENTRSENISYNMSSKYFKSFNLSSDVNSGYYSLLPWEINSTGQKVYLDYAFYFFSPASIGDSEPSYGGSRYNVHYDSIQIQGKYFMDVREFVLVNQGTQDLRGIRKILWARHVGIIFKEYMSGEVWELVNYYKAP